jgi:hypothetical protein
MEQNERKQIKQVSIRMTEAQYAQLKCAVSSSGLSQAEFLRRMIMNIPIVSTVGFLPMVAELKRIGNNANQIAKGINNGSITGFDEINQDLYVIRREMERIWELLRKSI